MSGEVESVLIQAGSLFIVNMREVDCVALQDIQMLPFALILKADSVWDFEAENVKCVHSFRFCDFIQEKIYLLIC